jgi:hypothetical protein
MMKVLTLAEPLHCWFGSYNFFLNAGEQYLLNDIHVAAILKSKTAKIHSMSNADPYLREDTP